MSAEDAAVQAKLQDGLRELREVENGSALLFLCCMD